MHLSVLKKKKKVQRKWSNYINKWILEILYEKKSLKEKKECMKKKVNKKLKWYFWCKKNKFYKNKWNSHWIIIEHANKKYNREELCYIQ